MSCEQYEITEMTVRHSNT